MADTDNTNANGEDAAKQPRDLTASVHDPREGDPENDPVFQRTRKAVIRFGTVFFGLLAMGMFIPMMIGVGQGIAKGRVWDPYTGQPVYETSEEDPKTACVEKGRALLLEAGRHETLVRVWAEPYRDWQLRCRASHPELYEMLSQTREELRLKKKAPPTDK